MANLSVVTINRDFLELKDIVLRQKAAEVPLSDTNFMKLCRKLALEMFDIMYASDGAGLAAPQVGVSLRMVVMDPKSLKFGPHVLINPKFLFKSEELEPGDEGCLSLPRMMGKVLRSKQVHVQTYNLSGISEEFKVDGWLGRVFQHELDHLDGILYADHVENNEDLFDSPPLSGRRAVKAMSQIAPKNLDS